MVILTALACWNVLAIRRSPPEKLLGSFDKLHREVAELSADVVKRVLAIETNEAARAVSAERLKSEFVELLEQQDDVLERIDTKRRRVDASESRAQRRGGNGQVATEIPVDVDAARTFARSQGMM